jgi:hypothetical protein
MHQDNKRLPRYRRSHFECSWSSQNTTDSYADLGEHWDTRGYYYKTVELRNLGDTNAIDYRILGSMDGTTFNTSITTGNLSASNHETIDINAFIASSYIPYIKLQIKAAVGGQQSEVMAVGACM